MAARVTVLNRTDPSIRKTMLAVDAKELLAVDTTGEWYLLDPESEERARLAAEAAKNIAAEMAAKESKREMVAAVNVTETAAKRKADKAKADQAAAADPLA